jgi:hypothetical protein
VYHYDGIQSRAPGEEDGQGCLERAERVMAIKEA